MKRVIKERRCVSRVCIFAAAAQLIKFHKLVGRMRRKSLFQRIHSIHVSSYVYFRSFLFFTTEVSRVKKPVESHRLLSVVPLQLRSIFCSLFYFTCSSIQLMLHRTEISDKLSFSLIKLFENTTGILHSHMIFQ